eukprot:scaffold132507_cov38-Attheya_sp.AAC.1
MALLLSFQFRSFFRNGDLEGEDGTCSLVELGETVAVMLACLLDMIALPSLSIRVVVALHTILGFFFVVVGFEARLGDTGIGRLWLAERRVWGVGGFRRVVGGGSRLNLVGGLAGAVGHMSAMVWFEVGIGFHCRKR